MVTAEITLWGNRLGAVVWDERRNSASFAYDNEFRKSGLEPSPLMMPTTQEAPYEFSTLNKETFMGLPGLLADALPDAFGKALLDRWLASVGKTFANPIERLCYQGKRSMGALEFQPAYAPHLETSTKLEMDSLVSIAHEVLIQKEQLQTNLSDDKREAIANIIKVGTSAGGQRAKAVIAYNDKTGEVRSGQVEVPEGYRHWLIKLDGVTNKELGDPQHYGEIEYIHYLMAKEAGIDMMECRLLQENGRAHFMARRFDRINGDKMHMQTLCGIAHYDYKMLHAYSYEQAFQVMRRLHLPFDQAEEFFRRMVFNVVACNQDDHTKNISFLMDQKGVWSLSPAYDMSWSFNPAGDWTSQHQMSINNKWIDITRADLLEVAHKMSIKHATAIIDRVIEAVSHWQEYAKDYEIPYETVAMIERTHVYL